MLLSEIFSSDISEYTVFQIKKIFCIYKNQFLAENEKFIVYFFAVFFFQITSKVN